MGGAQPLAATMAGASMLAVECQRARIEKRLETGYLDRRAHSLEEALAIIHASKRSRQPVSVALLANAAQVLPELLRRDVRPDAVTDQTSAHDPVNGYLPQRLDGGAVGAMRRDRSASASTAAARESMAPHVERCWHSSAWGSRCLTTATTYARSRSSRASRMLRYPRLRAGVHPAAVLSRRRPVPLGGAVGRPGRHLAHRRQGEGTDARRPRTCTTGSTWRAAHQVPGPAGAHLLGGIGRPAPARAGVQRDGGVRRASAPIVIGRDHLDSGSVASPNRETEAMRDGSDAVSDWPLLNALLNTASGATWVSFHHGGGVGMGYSQHAGVVIVCDGTPAAARRIARVLWNDPASGVMRHADAGYPRAIACAREHESDAADAGRVLMGYADGACGPQAARRAARTELTLEVLRSALRRRRG